MEYPGKVVRAGDGRVEVVKAVQERLNEVGCGEVVVDGVFGSGTVSSVKLFQTRRDLLPDGAVGPATWFSLFQEEEVHQLEVHPLLKAVIESAKGEVGTKESGRNRGSKVDEYIRSVGLDPTKGEYAWCQAFVYWNFSKAASGLQIQNPCIKTAGVLSHWTKAPDKNKIAAEVALDDPKLIRPGAIFMVDHGEGKGHTGLVESVKAGRIHTIEGNTNKAGSREGDGVYEKDRSIASITLGFIDYAL